MIYLDHPATSWPKPPSVLRAMSEFLRVNGGNPGRSGHRLSITAGRVIYETREALASFFGAPRPENVIFAHNATHALNMVVQTVLRPGDTVLTTSVEHNSVIRPLRAMEALGVRVVTAPCGADGQVLLSQFEKLAAEGVRLVVLNHASNVIGQITPVADLARVAGAAGAMVLVDAAQTAGVVPVDAREMGADYIAFTGHKALQGPPGTGGLVLCGERAVAEIRPLIRGGTGSRSRSQEQPDMLPDMLESGTPNSAGIAGLGAAIQWIGRRSLRRIQAHHEGLIEHLLTGLDGIPQVEVFGPRPGVGRAPLVSFRVRGKTVSEVGERLDDDYGILCRVGLHCAPAAHQTIGTLPEGAVRFGVGPFTIEDDVEQAIRAVAEIASDG